MGRVGLIDVYPWCAFKQQSNGCLVAPTRSMGQRQRGGQAWSQIDIEVGPRDFNAAITAGAFWEKVPSLIYKVYKVYKVYKIYKELQAIRAISSFPGRFLYNHICTSAPVFIFNCCECCRLAECTRRATSTNQTRPMGRHCFLPRRADLTMHACDCGWVHQGSRSFEPSE